MHEIYLDNAAGTPIALQVIRAVTSAMREAGNPSSFNDAGRRSRRLREDARSAVARFLHARPDEITFHPSASDANKAAISGVLGSVRGFPHAITTAVEHRSVREAFRGRRAALTVIAVDGQGHVGVGDIAEAVTRSTVLVSVMYANNEIGTIQPIRAIAKAIRAHRRTTGTRTPYLHVDASQAAGYLPMDVQVLGADLVTLSGAKIHGPRGIAALYVRRGVWAAITEGAVDVAGAVGFAEALRLIRPADGARVSRLRDRLLAGLMRSISDVRLNGPAGASRLANNVNVSIAGCTSEELLLELDAQGIRAGSGSACTAYSTEPSHVLRAIGVPRKYLDGALRFTLSRYTRAADIERVLHILPRAVRRVRARRGR